MHLRRIMFIGIAMLGMVLAVVRPASAVSFFNNTPIVIPNSGSALPYPSEIVVSGQVGMIADVAVTLYGFAHNAPRDVDMLLMSPFGTGVILMSDACGDAPIIGMTYQFDDGSGAMPANASCTTGGYDPTNYPPDETFNAFFGAIHPTLAGFNGQDPNGTWRLLVVDDNAENVGTINGGWELQLAYNAPPITIPASGSADPYPYTINVSGQTGALVDMLIGITTLRHANGDDIDMLLVSPNGIAVMLMSDACGGAVPGVSFTFTDTVLNTSYINPPDGGPCVSASYHPTNWDDHETMPAPAPPPPYFNRLSAFHGINPNGEWKLYIRDDTAGADGFITGAYLDFATVPTLPNLLTNGNFGSGESGWQEFGGGAGSVSGGVYQFQRTAASSAFTVFQTILPDFPPETPYELRFDMGNTDSERKRITVVMWDVNFSRQRACSFWLAPNQPMRTYQIISDVLQGHTWSSVTVHFYASSVRTNTNGFYQLDNVVLRRRDDMSFGAPIHETLCIDTSAPPPDADQPLSALWLNNSDFSTPLGVNAEGAWALVGNITGGIVNGVLNVQRTGDPAGSALQNTNVALAAGTPLDLYIDLGNSAPSWQRATILLHNESFVGLQFCTFWLPPNAPIATYRMTTSTPQAWDAQGISFSLYPSTSNASILVDNVYLRANPFVKLIGTGCYEPNSTYPAGDLPFIDTPFGLAAPSQPAIQATAIPYVAPGMASEQPLGAPPVPEVENTAGEGTISE
jgi:subtilisin-like proprotein convertase family protein